MTEREPPATGTDRATPLGPAVLELLGQARAGLAAAAFTSDPAERYVAAHRAALRAATAVLAARARPSRSQRPRSLWTVLPVMAPELSEWAAFFAVTARRRAAAEAGLVHTVGPRDADDLLRDADTFLAVVVETLGLPHQEPLAGAVVAFRGKRAGQ